MADRLRTNLAVKFSLWAVSRAVLGCLLGATLLASGTPARAGDDNVPIDTKFFRSMLEGLGLRKEGEDITYVERAPLVIPPSRALPPPEKSDAAVARNPAWPKDPDVQRQKAEAARDKTEIISAGEQQLRDERVLKPNELNPGPTPRTASRSAGPGSSQSETWGYGEKLSSSQLGYKGNLFSNMFAKDKDKEDITSFTKEPPRTALTEPPPGYQTPSPEQPFGLGKEKPRVPTSKDYMLDHPVGDQ
jgi:hypothetical protein